MRTYYQIGLILFLSLSAVGSFAATAPYSESFEGYATGDTAVTNFTEASSSAWGIFSPSFSGKAYENGISVFSAGVGVAVGANSSSGISFPALATSSFSMSTEFRIDSFTNTGSDDANTGTIGLFARGADATPASSNSDRYQVSYFLDSDGLGHATGRLWLREVNLFFGASLNEISTSSLPITLGNIYELTIAGMDFGGSLDLTATLTDTTTSTSISVSGSDSSNLLTGDEFGYFNHVRVEDGGTVSLNADFDNFSMLPEPSASILILLGLGICFAAARRR
ncbi:MAG: PEP-CTERM sorting domain-containing protein [Pirellulales bacterium]|nr:PEP-CTERM sorting domain-containing protein [Pirellulales bacterium]